MNKGTSNIVYICWTMRSSMCKSTVLKINGIPHIWLVEWFGQLPSHNITKLQGAEDATV
jgi:hypothetical protein